MPDTETLEVKEVKMIETEVTEAESKIEASVGENDVVALVDEAEHLNNSDTSEEMETNAGSEAQLEAVVEENQKLIVEKTSEKMDIEDSTHNVDSTTVNNSRISTEPEIKEESSENIPEETKSNTVITVVDSAKETDPSIISTDDSNKGDPTTQSVLQKAEDSSQLNMEQKEEEDAQIAKQETTIPFKEEPDVTCNQESDPSSNVLKSVVETTITDQDLILTATPSTTSVNYLIPQSSTISTTTISSVEQTSSGGKTGQPPPPGSQGLPMLVKPPKTDDLLQTAREVLQLRDEPAGPDVLIGEFLVLQQERIVRTNSVLPRPGWSDPHRRNYDGGRPAGRDVAQRPAGLRVREHPHTGTDGGGQRRCPEYGGETRVC